MQQSSLSRIVESKEQKFGMLVEQAQGCQDVVDCLQRDTSVIPFSFVVIYYCNKLDVVKICRQFDVHNLHQLIIHMMSSQVSS